MAHGELAQWLAHLVLRFAAGRRKTRLVIRYDILFSPTLIMFSVTCMSVCIISTANPINFKLDALS